MTGTKFHHENGEFSVKVTDGNQQIIEARFGNLTLTLEKCDDDLLKVQVYDCRTDDFPVDEELDV